VEELRREIIGLFLQVCVFLSGLVLSLGLGMLLAARTEGPGSLLVVTLMAGLGLLGAAVLSQIVRDRIVYGRDR
jgi:hypothetical protein